MLTKKSLITPSSKNSTRIANAGLKQPFRVGKYWKSSSSLGNKQQNDFTPTNDFVVNNKIGKVGNLANNQLYVLKEELYSSSYHSFHSLENLNLPPGSTDYNNDFENQVNPKIANIKSHYDDETFIDRSTNKLMDDSFISDTTDSLLNDDINQLNDDTFEETHFVTLAHAYKNKSRQAEGYFK